MTELTSKASRNDEISCRTALLSDQIPICRICLDDGDPNKIIRPCKCRGTQASVHVDCVRDWLSASGKRRCEICKNDFGIKQQKLRPFTEWQCPGPKSDIVEDQVEFLTLIVWCFFTVRIVYCIMALGLLTMHYELVQAFQSQRIAIMWWLMFIFNSSYYFKLANDLYDKWLIENSEIEWVFEDNSKDTKASESSKKIN